MTTYNEIKLLCETFLIWQIFDKIQWKIALCALWQIQCT